LILGGAQPPSAPRKPLSASARTAKKFLRANLTQSTQPNALQKILRANSASRICALVAKKNRDEKLVSAIAQRVGERGTVLANSELMLSIVIATFASCESNRIAAAAC
jgi:cobalamin biosynthesis protein CbiD